MKEKKVVIVKCNSYDADEVKRSLERGLRLLEFDFSQLNHFLLKPNLCLPVNPELSLTTHPMILSKLIELARESTPNAEISIGDTAIGAADETREEKLWLNTGMKQLENDYGIYLNNLNQRIVKAAANIDGMDYSFPISEDIIRHPIINIPKFKAHGYMVLTGCVKNLYGILAGDAKKLFHKIAGDKEKFAKILLEIYRLADCRLHIVDGVWGIEGDGPGAKGLKRKFGFIALGLDGIAVDCVLTKIMGLERENVLTNRLPDDERIVVLGDSIESLNIHNFILPTVNQRTDKVIEHAIESKRAKIEIVPEKCRRCGQCAKNCPADAIYYENDSFKINREKCLACLVCMETCLYEAVEVKRIRLF